VQRGWRRVHCLPTRVTTCSSNSRSSYIYILFYIYFLVRARERGSTTVRGSDQNTYKTHKLRRRQRRRGTATVIRVPRTRKSWGLHRLIRTAARRLGDPVSREDEAAAGRVGLSVARGRAVCARTIHYCVIYTCVMMWTRRPRGRSRLLLLLLLQFGPSTTVLSSDGFASTTGILYIFIIIL